MSNSSTVKEVLKPILSEMIQSKVFDAAYDACVGFRIILDEDGKTHDIVTIDLHDAPDSNVAFGTFEIENGSEIFSKVKETICEFYQGNFTYLINNNDGTISLVDICKSVKSLLEEADDIILADNSDHDFEGYQQVSFYSPTNRGTGETFYIKLDD